MVNDIPGTIRQVIGFDKIPSKYGNHLVAVEYDLKPIDLDYLKSIFTSRDDDPYLIDPYKVNDEQAKLLQPYVIDGVIDLDKYIFNLDCYKDPEYDDNV